MLNSDYKKKWNKARKEFLKIVSNQEKEIDLLFEELATELDKNKKKISNKAALIIFINKLLKGYDAKLYKIIKNNIDKTIELYDEYDKKEEVTDTILSGELYNDKLNLNKRCTKAANRTENIIKKYINNMDEDINITVIIAAVINYLKPSKKDRRIEYNFLRNARTTLSHTAREIIIENARCNKECIGIKWELDPSHYERMPQGDECDDYAENDWYGLGIGIFPINEVPMPHSNCLCHLYPVVAR